jgi:hypothetical protein
MHPEDIVSVAALIHDAIEELSPESSPVAVMATGRLHAAARILARADREAAEEMRRRMAVCDSYRTDDTEDLPF